MFALYGLMWPRMALCGLIWSCCFSLPIRLSVHGLVWHSKVLYGILWSYKASYGLLLQNIVFSCDSFWKHLDLSPYDSCKVKSKLWTGNFESSLQGKWVKFIFFSSTIFPHTEKRATLSFTGNLNSVIHDDFTTLWF